MGYLPSTFFVPVFNDHLSLDHSQQLVPEGRTGGLVISKTVPNIEMLGVGYSPVCSVSVTHVFLTQTSKSTAWRHLSYVILNMSITAQGLLRASLAAKVKMAMSSINVTVGSALFPFYTAAQLNQLDLIRCFGWSVIEHFS